MSFYVYDKYNVWFFHTLQVLSALMAIVNLIVEIVDALRPESMYTKLDDKNDVLYGLLYCFGMIKLFYY